MGLALETALWCRYCYGTTESGKTIEPKDPSWDRLVPVARAAKVDAMAWLAMEDVYGEVGRDFLINRAWRLGVAANQQIDENFKFFYLQGPNYLTAMPLPPIFVKMIVSLGKR